MDSRLEVGFEAAPTPRGNLVDVLPKHRNATFGTNRVLKFVPRTGLEMLTVHFSDLSTFPDVKITAASMVSRAFLELGIEDFRTAARFIHAKPYWKNTDANDVLSVLKEGHGTCVSKHNLMVGLGAEHAIPIHRFEGVYPLTDRIVTGVSAVLEKHGLKQIPRTHCFLECGGEYFDLTDGNCTGKNGLITEYYRIEKVGMDNDRHVLLEFLKDFRIVDSDFQKLDDEDFLRILNECTEYNFGLCKRGATPTMD